MDKALKILMERWRDDLLEAGVAISGCQRLDNEVYDLIKNVVVEMNAMLQDSKT